MKVKLIDLIERYKEEKKELISCFKNTVSKGHLVLTKEVSDIEVDIADLSIQDAAKKVYQRVRNARN